MKTLQQLHDDLNGLTDKGTTHSYVETYAKLFEPYRDQLITILEIGVQHGGSIELWAKYFNHPSTLVYGADVEDTRQNLGAWKDPRMVFLLSHYADIESTFLKVDGIDILIDDGMHFLSQQLHAFQKFWPLINPGGLYIIEDIQSDADCEALMAAYPFEKIDLRHVKDRYDDVLLVARKAI
jgi:cephalosporin hydroxylase